MDNQTVAGVQTDHEHGDRPDTNLSGQYSASASSGLNLVSESE